MGSWVNSLTELTGFPHGGSLGCLCSALSKTFCPSGKDKEMQEGNGAVNVSAVKIAKEASIPKFVYVSVASIVKDVVGNVLLKG